MMKYKLQDLIDINHFQNLQDRLNQIYSFPSSIIDNDGNILTATAWQDVCSQFHRKNKECERECIKSDQYILDHLHEANPAVSYRCPHGLVDNATPIIINGVHYGNFFTGQFFLEEPNLDFFRSQANRYGFKEDAYIEAVKKVPIWTQKQLENYLFFIKGLIAVIAESGLKKLKEIENKKEIEKSELKYRTLFEKSRNAIFLVDKKTGRYLDANAAALELTGYTLTEIRTRKTKDLTPDGAEKRLNTIMTSDESLEFGEVVYHRKDGSNRAAILSIVPLNENMVFGIAQDIAKYKQVSEALQESEIKYRQLTETMLETLSVIDLNGVFLYANRNAIRNMSGGKSGDITGENIRHFLSVDQAEQLIGLYKKVYSSGKAYSHEILVHLEQGGTWFLNTLKPIDFGRSQIPAVLSVSIDITKSKKAELALRESEEKFRRLVNTAPYGIQLTDTEGKILVSNPAHHKIQGYADGDLVGKYIWDLMADDHHRSETKGYYERLIKEQPLPEVYFNRDLTRDGREIDVQINWDYLRTAKGEVEGIISIISDITEQKALESKLQQAQKMESIGNLAGGIAHDFNNILFPIIGMSEMLLEDLPPGSIERENAEEIFKAGKRAGDLVKQILAFSRQSEHKLTPIRLQNIIKEVIKLSRASIPTYIEIRQEIQQDCGLVMADPSQIHQIGMNLITNAYHAVEEKGGKIFIKLIQASINDAESHKVNLRPGAYAVLSISDTGHGMSEEIMAKIFDPYFTTKAQGKGTGLGLAVVYGIVKEHQGDIKVSSEIGKGSTFDIYLPLMKRDDRIESVHASEAYRGGDERILLVDDEESVAKLEKQMLERMGYKVTCRLHSVEALEAFRASPFSFDLVISDMSMPNIPGDELARKIKSIRSDVPIIICTGFSERIHEDNIRQMVMDGLLMKPVAISELAKTVREMLDKSKKS